MCTRPVCGRCANGGRCGACAALRPIPAEELPDELRGSGHHVVAGSSNGVTVVLLAGGIRRELVLFRGGALETWRSYSRADQWEWRIAFEACGERPVGSISHETLDVPDGVPEGAVIKEQVVWSARLLCDGRPVRQDLPLPGRPPTDATMSQQVARLLNSPVRIPEQCDPADAPAELDLLAGRGDLPAATALSVQLVPHLQRIWLERDGIHVMTGFADEAEHRVSEFERCGVADVEFVADEVRTAETEGVRVAWMVLGPVHLLHVESDSRRTWHRLDRSGVDPTTVLLGRSLTGVRQPLAVAALTTADQITGPVVQGGRLVSRTTRLFVEDSDEPGDPRLTEALAEEMGCVRPEAFGAPVPQWASWMLPVSPRVTPRPVAVGQSVLERWAVRQGRTWLFAAGDGMARLDYDVPAGHHQGFVTAHDSGRRADTVAVDRSMHLVEELLECGYCQTMTCTRCEDPVESCIVCETKVCGRCATPAHPLPICPACSRLAPAGRRALRRRIGNSGRMLVGDDQLHSVAVLPDHPDPVVEVSCGEGTIVLPLSRAGFGYVQAPIGSPGTRRTAS